MKDDRHLMESDATYRVCIVGVGFVGLTLAIALTEKGVSVRGLERNEQLVSNLNRGETDVLEPGLDSALDDALERNLFRVYGVGVSEEELTKCNVFIVTVGTPIRDRSVNLQPLSSAIDEIIPYLGQNDLVIVRSTVMVGSTRDLVLPKLQAAGRNISLAMCPERTIEGSALAEIESLPQIIGALNDASATAAVEFFSIICNEVIQVDSLEAAEITKLVNNTYRDLMFGFSNEIARIANGFNVSARQIIQAANKNYPRSNIALPGPSGGPCLEKDPWILIESAHNLDITLDITKSARLTNETMISEFLRESLKGRERIKKVGILGLAFKAKPLTRDTRGSAAFDVLDFFKVEFPEVTFIGHEPAGIVKGFEDEVRQLSSVSEVLANCEVIVILTNSDSFQPLNEMLSILGKQDLLVIDFWNIVSREAMSEEQVLCSWGG